MVANIVWILVVAGHIQGTYNNQRTCMNFQAATGQGECQPMQVQPTTTVGKVCVQAMPGQYVCY